MPEKLRIAFMGTPDFAVPALEALLESGHDVICVYSQPPRPKGRGQQVLPSPVDEAASLRGIPVFTPKSLRRDEQAQADFCAHDLDLAVVAAYGLLLPKKVLEAPRLGCLNIHASLLPRWRGASPIQHAIWKGDAESGITIMQMEEGLDTGPMIDRQAITITPDMTAQILHDELAALGAAMIGELVARYAAGEDVAAERQDDSLATYAPLLKKEDGVIDWKLPAAEIDRQIRALNPWPGVWTGTSAGKRLKILAAEPVNTPVTGAPGVLGGQGHVACGGGTALRLLKVQPESAKPMDAVGALNGGYLKSGEVLG